MTATIIYKQPMNYDAQLTEVYKSLHVAVMIWATLTAHTHIQLLTNYTLNHKNVTFYF